MKETIAGILLAVAMILGLTACDGETSTTNDDDTYPHGIIYVPRVGTSPGIGPIFY
ncbi:hypothetical protein SEA_SOILDRAGON_42 [Mycobacterium phage SoilDragon]|uniref:Lipoprotein n=2 Tax=Microwolfvirus TaxID=2942894 RepID=A0A516KUH1_9CAUD|nr:hypothetical protein M611_gp54 [Mycobacterium phage Jobu08]YP_010060083.1 hypothetical protein KIJ58_gp58 [Mycobacterium phage SoilDragon]YP_010060172.1 hypothetical protein KIJ59_gp49 [Mycobacterium phage Zetzy]AGM61560.1 hypothetical protein PBI_JOBU08_41 [Mycobacterium phage Jobu08]AZS12011.1 hypothetical protein SEA_ZETZY_41 [Mycobacterium phage Zetzy]QDP45341.1 hypothetical protein SEA_SOILDRAGON_42 [Mycobacterium phage SoilDragon]